jgi:branched-chain amino acid transport system permease protein
MSTYQIGIVILMGINLLVVLGLSLLTGFTGLFSFGNAGFMAIGGYTAVLLTTRLETPFLVALLLGGGVASLFAAMIGKITLSLKGDYFCIATLGMGESIRLFLNNIQFFGGSRGIPGIPQLTTVWHVLGFDLLCVLILVNILQAKHGRCMVAVREEELAAEVIGISSFKYKLTSFMLSACFAGVAGGLLAHYMSFIQPNLFTYARSTELTIMVIFGGLGSLSGSIISAMVLTALPEVLRAFSEWRLVCYGLAVILMMISRPEGLMGGHEITLEAIHRVFRNVQARLQRGKVAMITKEP